MTRSLRAALALVLTLPGMLGAQMTIGGYVRNGAGAPVPDANVAITALGASTRTNTDGSYNILLRAALVRGQTVAMTARHGRFGTQTVQVQIVGGSLRQDFVLSTASADSTLPRRGIPRSAEVPRASGRSASTLLGDNALAEAAAVEDIESALATRFAPLRVTPATTPGGSSFVVYRGIRSLAGDVKPLVVVDGVPIDNVGFSSADQRAGLGGFDYGAPLSDIALADVDRVELLDPITASVRYGSRAANGVIEVRTRSGRGLTGFGVSLTQRVAGSLPGALPDFQNAFGQGLGGAFEFFDGLGGGVNDAVEESWGPRLDASPVAQHSLTEARRPDVRYWLPQPDDTREYFERGPTIETNLAVLGSRERSHLRAAVTARRANGLTPEHQLTRFGLSLGGGVQPSRRVSMTAHLQYIVADADRRPGTGFDEVNPVAGFTRMGRQVDLDALRANLTDADGAQINWIYTDRNNPLTATTRNSNGDDRRHLVAAATLSYDVTSVLTATVSAATDDWRERRHVSVATGWLGGFPTSAGRRDFAGGGSDEHELESAERLARVALASRPVNALGMVLSGFAGGEVRQNEFRSNSVVTDQPATGPASVTALERSGTHGVTSAFGYLSAARGFLRLDAGARLDRSSSLAKSYAEVYPSAQVTLDMTRLASQVAGLGESRVIARVWEAGNELTRRTLATTYFPGDPTQPENEVAGPERTSALEVTLASSSRGGRGVFAVTGYRERSTDLLVIVPDAGGSALLSQTGQVFNGGVQASARIRVLGAGPTDSTADGNRWDVQASFARNSSTVDRLASGGTNGDFEAPLSPMLFGARVVARVGSPAGVIAGSRLLRNGNGELLLRDGLPLADATAPFSVLGSIQPDWTATLRSEASIMGLELGVALDVRMGGEIFSATNMWGSYAGTLASTLVGDRAPGATPTDSLVVSGTDSTTGSANTTRVSAEAYFHALGAITEPWVYDASYTRVREIRVSYGVPTRFLPGFRQHSLRISLVGRNLVTWTSVPNIDPETTLSPGVLQGIEMGQLPGRRSLALQFELSP